MFVFLPHILWLCLLGLNSLLTWASVVLGTTELFWSFSNTGLGHIPDKCELVCYFYHLYMGQTEGGTDSRGNEKHLTGDQCNSRSENINRSYSPGDSEIKLVNCIVFPEKSYIISC